jgi:hypothetical protein
VATAAGNGDGGQGWETLTLGFRGNGTEGGGKCEHGVSGWVALRGQAALISNGSFPVNIVKRWVY